MIFQLVFDLIVRAIVDLIPKKIRNIVGVVLIIIGILGSFIVISLSLLLATEDKVFALVFGGILALPIVLIFLVGFYLILSTRSDEWEIRNSKID